jgi:hypothetical protein
MAPILLETYGMCKEKKKPVNDGLFLYDLGFKENIGSFRNSRGFHGTVIFKEATVSLDKNIPRV